MTNVIPLRGPAPKFTPADGAVYMGPARLSEASVNAILDVFEAEDCPTLFNELYEAGQVAGFIPRVSTFTTKAKVHSMLTRSMETIR